MADFQNILAFDTSGPHVAGWLRLGDACFWKKEEMARGQAERLVVLLQELLAQGGTDWKGLDALAVGIGPGNFTGIRISVAAALGLSLSLGIPAVGVSLFEVRAMGSSRENNGKDVLVCLPAPRDTLYTQLFRDDKAIAAPRHFEPGKSALLPEETGAVALIANAQKSLLPKGIEIARFPAFNRRALSRTEMIARERLTSGQAIPRPVPMYIRPADAAPPKDAPVRVI